jgi:peptide deformylase
MALLSILRYPDVRLQKVASPVADVDDRVRRLVADLAQTMYEANGIGLAATQVDVHRQVIVIDVSETRDDLRVFINPRILELKGDKVKAEEGCLSVPDIYDVVERFTMVRVEALDQQGKRFELEAQGMLAVCIQHEMDHLRGRVFVDYLSQLKQTRIKGKMRKLERQSA